MAVAPAAQDRHACTGVQLYTIMAVLDLDIAQLLDVFQSTLERVPDVFGNTKLPCRQLPGTKLARLLDAFC